MTYRVRLADSAAKEFNALDGSIQRRVRAAIDALATTPRPAGMKKLKGGDDLYRVRVGDYRVVYSINDKVLVILVVRVSHRREVYR